MYRISSDFGITPKFSNDSILYYTFELEKDKKKIYEDYWTMEIYCEKKKTIKIYDYSILKEQKSSNYLLSSKKSDFNSGLFFAANNNHRELVINYLLKN
jgi:hypothetical protein